MRTLADTQRVVVTGLGVINAIGDSVAQFWHHLKEGKNGIRKITLFDPQDYSTDFAGEITITDEHYQRFASRKTAKRLDRCILFNCLAAQESFADADIKDAVDAHPERYASLISTGSGGTGSYNRGGHASIAQSMDAVHPMTLLNVIPNTAAGYFAQTHNLQGPSFSVSSACSTSNYSIALATHFIKSGFLDGAFAGGAEAAICPLGIGSFGNIFALSRNKEELQKLEC